MADMNYEWEPLADGVHRCRLPFLDVTVGVVAGAAGVLLVDCGTTLTEANAVAADVTMLTGRAVTHVVMTHHHFDHILGSGAFPDAQHYAAPAVAAALTAGVDELRSHAARYGAEAGDIDDAVGELRAPDQVMLHTRIDLSDRVILVEHPGRGHTDHDLVVVVPALHSGDHTVVFCGDLVEESADPAIDEESDVAQWPSALDRVLGLGGPEAIYVPGHGAVVDADFVVRQREWLRKR